MIGLGAIPLCNIAWATTDLSTLGGPYVTISPNSGPPGTKITITVSHIPDISKTNYPYPDLDIYLPFSEPFGTTLKSQCGGQDCFPIYTHNDALNQDFADRVITFSLPSINNPKPIFLNGFENSVCDVTVNGKVMERFSTLCNTKDEPQGIYQIKLAWILESDSEQTYTTKIIPFLVTSGTSQSQSPIADNGNAILKEYQNGTISQAQFYTELKSRGWNDEQIRQALAVIGKLPHQMGIIGPDSKLPIYQTNSTNDTNTVQKNVTVSVIPQPEIKQNTNITKINEENNTSVPVQQNSTINPTQDNSTPASTQSDSIWNNIIVGLSILAAAIMAGVFIFVKMYRNKGNTR